MGMSERKNYLVTVLCSGDERDSSEPASTRVSNENENIEYRNTVIQDEIEYW